jgi:hypothetical protein
MLMLQRRCERAVCMRHTYTVTKMHTARAHPRTTRRTHTNLYLHVRGCPHAAPFLRRQLSSPYAFTTRDIRVRTPWSPPVAVACSRARECIKVEFFARARGADEQSKMICYPKCLCTLPLRVYTHSVRARANVVGVGRSLGAYSGVCLRAYVDNSYGARLLAASLVRMLSSQHTQRTLV